MHRWNQAVLVGVLLGIGFVWGIPAWALSLDEAKANGVPVTLWIAGGDGAMGGEKMNLDDAGHAATRDLIKARAGERMAEWKAPRS